MALADFGSYTLGKILLLFTLPLKGAAQLRVYRENKIFR
jgi:hypothetical protein